ncbi:MAG: hypothetical protein AB3A66_22215 [Nodularia sp. CChRGM 3473]
MIKPLFPSLLALFSVVSVASPVKAAILQTSPILELSNLNPVSNAVGTLTRRQESIEVNLNTQELPEGAHTVWWVIFNDPSFCVDGCGEDDFANPDVEASVIWATGNVVDNTGIGNFNAQLSKNVIPGDFLFGNGLLDSFKAEIHTVIRWHGEASTNPIILNEQLTTFNGGCTTTPGDGLFPCEDRQVAVFQQVSIPESSPIVGLITLGIFIGIPLSKRHN